MTEMNKLVLFPSEVYEFHIDPTQYDKKAIVDTVVENFRIEENRNNWDPTSKLHHYYDDWQNPKFKPVHFSNLGKLYEAVFKSFFEQLKPVGKHTVTYKLVNITVIRDSMFMNEHAHTDDNLFVSAVHYIKADPTSNPLIFKNPLIYSQYENWFTRGNYMEIFGRGNQNTSAWFQSWRYQPREDYMVIFPAYLKHFVQAVDEKSEGFRIGIVVNVSIGK